MNQLRIHNKYLELFTDDIDEAREVMDNLSCFVPGYEHDARFRIGSWSGKKEFYKISVVEGGWYFKIPLGFQKRVEALLNTTIQSEDLVIPDNDNPYQFLKRIIPELPFKPHKHQLKMFMNMADSIAHMGIAATGSGKSLVFYLLLRYFREQNKKILFLCPTIALTGQLKDDCEDYKAPDEFMEEIQLLGGDFTDKDIIKPMLFSTWQSAQKVDLTQFDVVLNDEVHRSAADVLQKILSNNFSIKLGATGTLPLEELSQMQLEQQFGQPKKYINARQMMNLGMATELTVVPIFLDHGRVKALKYQDEIRFVKDSKPRRAFVKKLLGGLTGLTVALYNHTELGVNTWEDLAGQKLTSKIKKSFELQKQIGVFFMSGGTPPKVRDEMRKYLTNHAGTATIIAQKTIMSTGINIKALKNLVFLSSSKSFTEIIQSIGRVLRLHDTKSKALVFDLVDEMSAHRKSDNHSLKHFYARLPYYEQEDFPIHEVEYKL